MSDETLNGLMAVSLLGPSVEAFDAVAVARRWLMAKSRRRKRLSAIFKPRKKLRKI